MKVRVHQRHVRQLVLGFGPRELLLLAKAQWVGIRSHRRRVRARRGLQMSCDSRHRRESDRRQHGLRWAHDERQTLLFLSNSIRTHPQCASAITLHSLLAQLAIEADLQLVSLQNLLLFRNQLWHVPVTVHSPSVHEPALFARQPDRIPADELSAVASELSVLIKEHVGRHNTGMECGGRNIGVLGSDRLSKLHGRHLGHIVSGGVGSIDKGNPGRQEDDCCVIVVLGERL